MYSENSYSSNNNFKSKLTRVFLIPYGKSLDSYLLDIDEDFLNEKDHLDDNDLDFLGVDPQRRQCNEDLEVFDLAY